jgi:hypothetical protein
MRRLSAFFALLAGINLPFPASPDRYTPIKWLHDRATLNAADPMGAVHVVLGLAPFLLLATALGRHSACAAVQVAGSAGMLLGSGWALLSAPNPLPRVANDFAALSLVFLSAAEGVARLWKSPVDPERRWRILLPLLTGGSELLRASLRALALPLMFWKADDVLWHAVYPLSWIATMGLVAWGAWAGARWASWIGALLHGCLLFGHVSDVRYSIPYAIETKGHSLPGLFETLLPLMALDATAATLFARDAWKRRVNSRATTLTEA